MDLNKIIEGKINEGRMVFTRDECDAFAARLETLLNGTTEDNYEDVIVFIEKKFGKDVGEAVDHMPSGDYLHYQQSINSGVGKLLQNIDKVIKETAKKFKIKAK